MATKARRALAAAALAVVVASAGTAGAVGAAARGAETDEQQQAVETPAGGQAGGEPGQEREAEPAREAPPEGERPTAGGGAPSPDADLGATDAKTALDSPATAFDTHRAWPLSMRDRVAPLVGEAVAARLLDDLNEYVAPSGARIDNPLDVMVSEDGVSRTAGTVRFRAMAYHGADRLVVDCAYDESTGAHAFEKLP